MSCSFSVPVPCCDASAMARNLLQKITQERPLFRGFQNKVKQCADLHSISDSKINQICVNKLDLAAKRTDYGNVLSALVQVGSVSPDLDRKIEQIGKRLTKLDAILQESEAHFSSLADSFLEMLHDETSLFELFQNALNVLAHPEAESFYILDKECRKLAKQQTILTCKKVGYEKELASLSILNSAFPVLEDKIVDANESLLKIDGILRDIACQLSALIEGEASLSLAEIAPQFLIENDEVAKLYQNDLKNQEYGKETPRFLHKLAARIKT